MSITTKAQANYWIKQGKAAITGYTRDDGQWWVIVTRYDVQHVDHYLAGDDLPDDAEEVLAVAHAQ